MANTNYDLTICYRIYPKVSKVPPVFSDDKYRLSELCLKSFAESLNDIKYKMFVLLDNCPPEYSELFKKYIPSGNLELIPLHGIGNAGTFTKQVELLLSQNYSENIYFAEDDYFYLPETFEELLLFLNSSEDVNFVSPYDHPDYYELELHNYKSEIRHYGGRHWRTGGSTCMTFLTTKKILNVTKGTFLTYTKNNYDASIWLSLTKYRIRNILLAAKYLFFDTAKFKIYVKAWLFCPIQILFGKKWKLWSPVPSISTHMDDRHLAPTINWRGLFSGDEKK